MTRYTITRCPGCGRMNGVNGSTCVRPSRTEHSDVAPVLGNPAANQSAQSETVGRYPSVSAVAPSTVRATPEREDPSPVPG